MDENQVRELANCVRCALEPWWGASQGRCNSAAALLVDILNAHDPSHWTLARGGACRVDEEFDPDTAVGHCWAQREDGLIADITGAQFGHPNDLVGPGWDADHLEPRENTYVWDPLEVERWRALWESSNFFRQKPPENP